MFFSSVEVVTDNQEKLMSSILKFSEFFHYIEDGEFNLFKNKRKRG